MICAIRRLPSLLLVPALLATACGTQADAGSGDRDGRTRSSSPPPRSSSSPEPAADPVISEVSAAQWRQMTETGMTRKGCPVTVPDELRRVEINHHGFDGEIHRGALVVNADTADSFVRIFTRLFEAGFPIRSMKPLEEFGGDSNASLRADNTAAFNCRRPDQINAPPTESPHANGRAVDINPRENPWKDLRCKCWSPGPEHKERTPGKGKILKSGLVWQVFIREGWIWQDIDVPDYMHFDTGYPSKPYVRPTATP